MSSGRLSEQEVATLLRRAAEAQAAGNAPRREGIGIDELRVAVAEIGITPEAFDTALSSLHQEREDEGLLGGPLALQRDTVVEGTLSDDAWEETVADLRRTFREQGTVAIRGTTREWTSSGMSDVTFSARQTDGEVRFSLSAVLGGAAIIPYVLTIIPIFIGMIFIAVLPELGLPLAMALRALWVVLMLLFARNRVTAMSRKTSRKWSGVFARAAERVEAVNPLERARAIEAPAVDVATEPA